MTEDTKDKTQAKAQTPAVTFTLNGEEVTVAKGTTLLEAARSNGIHIPTFCWHPKLKSVGSCRMCYVEVEKWPKLAVSCATEAMDGMIVHTDSDLVKQGRKAVLSFILANHPLDCPTCDKGGECDLQDLTFTHGIDDSDFDFQKNRFTSGAEASIFDDKRIGPEIILNRNRCILCYRCVRANKEAFGEYDLGVFERGNMAEIDAAPGRQVDNPFSGNLSGNCPVGALTSVDWRYKMRVWKAKTTPSICPFSSSGANTLIYSNKNKNIIGRVMARCNDDIDDGWLADITKYGYQMANSEERLQVPLIKKEGKQVEATWDEALEVIGRRFKEITEKEGKVCIGGLASPNLDNSSLFSFSKLFRTVLKNNNIDFRTDYRMLPDKHDTHFGMLCSRSFTIADIDDSDVIVVVGSDMIREHHNEYLRIRKAVNFHNARVFSLNPYAVKSADIAEAEIVYNIGTEEVLLTAIGLAAIELDLVDREMASGFADKAKLGSLAEAVGQCGASVETVRILARALVEARKVSIILGELTTSSRRREAIAAAMYNLNRLFGFDAKGQMAVLARYANSRGAELLGLLPYPSAWQTEKLKSLWGEFPDAEARSTDAILALMSKEEISGGLVLGANPVMLYPDRQFVLEALNRLDFMVACDLFETETTELADVVLPLSSWAEYEGTYVNLEGCLQVGAQAIKPIGQSKPAYEIVKLIAQKLDATLFESDQQLISEMDELLSHEHDDVTPDDFIEVSAVAEDTEEEYPIPLVVCDDPHHTGHLTQKSPSLSNFTGEAYVEMSADLAARLGVTEGQPVRVESPVGKIVVPVRVSEFIENDIVLMPRNFSQTWVTSLLMRKKRIDRVKITKVDE
ncbi:MAG: NADH-quinone oxidoreductase subunit NuoG [candidate division Zixibacteria bacterium]|nr:NADH-quinone oxidoreductase subunit NuoG [candidate division Zixibacteria bacterium]